MSDMDPKPFTADEREDLAQQLLELHFDCHPDPDALRARLARDPALRALDDDVRNRAAVLASAAHDEAADFAPELPTTAGQRRNLWPWIVPTLAAAALLVSASLWGYAEWRYSRACSQDYKIDLTSDAGVDGRPWSFDVDVQRGDGAPVDAPVTIAAFGSDEEEIVRFETRPGGEKPASVLPTSLRGARRLVATVDAHGIERRAELRIDPAGSRPLAHLQIDKPIYRPGETMRVRGVALQRLDLSPSAALAKLLFRILGPDDSVVARPSVVRGDRQLAEHGVAAGTWDIPEDLPGGRYRLEWYGTAGETPAASEDFIIRRFTPPRLDTRIVLDRASYAPGSTGTADVHVRRIAGELDRDADLRAALIVDGEEVWSSRLGLDAHCRARVQSDVPTEVAHGDARFVASVTDGATQETTIEAFAVPNGALEVGVYPEGGDLVAGVESRVYVNVTDSLGRPTSARGVIVGPSDRVVARFATEHAGRASLRMTPRAGERYRCRLEGSAAETELPPVRQNGLVLTTLDDRIPPGAPLRLRHTSIGRSADWTVGVFCRGACIAEQPLPPASAPSEVTVRLPDQAFGVLRVTVFDENLLPRAERLVQRDAFGPIQLEVLLRDEQLAPGAAQTLRVLARGDDGRPLPQTALGLAVSDGAVRALAGEPRLGLLDRASLFGDVTIQDDLADYLPATAGSGRHTDLLLGTLGWRRFEWLQVPESSRPQRASSGFADWRGIQQSRRDTYTAQRRFRRWATVSIALLVLYLLMVGAVQLARRARWTQSRLGDAVAAATPVCACFLLMLLTWQQFGGSMVDEVMLGRAPEAKAEIMADGAAMVPGERIALDGLLDAADDANILELDERREDELEAEPAVAQPDAPDRDRLGFGRVYAHRRAPLAARGFRSDFTETVMWDALLLTDDEGVATCSFDTSDRVTTWQVDVDAHGHGRVGQAKASFDTVLPFSMDISLPSEVSEGDRLDIPIAFATSGEIATREPLREVEVSVRTQGESLRNSGGSRHRCVLEDGRGGLRLPIEVGPWAADDAAIAVVASAGQGLRDAVQRRLRVVPRGFPHRRSWAGAVARDATGFEIPIPADLRPGSVRVRLRAFPSPVAMLRQGLDGILQEPHGCFEQASSSNYPNTLVLAYLEASGDVIPSVSAEASALLPRGYEKIAGYECSRRGYEWFGSNPGHESLTAYGLLQFTDMRRVYDGVDATMLQRTQDRLLARRDGSGGYLANAAALDSFGRSSGSVSNAYATYALLYSGKAPETLRTELEALSRRAPVCRDAYELAILAAALQLGGAATEAAAARQRLVSMQRDDGALVGSTTITRSGGKDLAVETTAFAALAWLADPARRHLASVQRACAFLQSQQSARGTFGATQATIMALKALTEQARSLRQAPQAGELAVLVDGVEVARQKFTSGEADPIHFDLASHLIANAAVDVGDRPSRSQVQLVATFEDADAEPAPLPWACDLEYRSDQPADDPAAVVGIETRLARDRAARGEVIALQVTVTNLSEVGQPMALAKVGLPAGLNAPTTVLDALRDAGHFDLWEIRGREIAFYWRSLEPRATQSFSIDCIAAIPGRTTGPASCAGLYYTPEMRRWAPELTVAVR